ncbi:copper amine oxidase N-terminal domain-containing protein [Bacillus sp. E(2018)]|uniref:copper amine oxidase N-terminal domain-containing protein n=1 Tax=Bacillus sp. E(2018) TaxID=2502239 RepID=UPI0010F60360|nr:copper amine oxidase N-terminal domain-containing protein [Bacillus sp. E(2018)]
MKHLIKIIFRISLLIAVFTVNEPVHAVQNITVKINGQALYFDQYLVIENNRVLVPMRTYFEVMGANVEWEAKTSTVKAKRGNTSILLPLNSKQATINGEKNSLDVPAKAIKGRTMVPLRFVSESLGCKVKWNGKSITFDGEVKEQTGKVYSDGWVAPLLKSAWSPDPATNFETLESELGFDGNGHYFGIYGKTRAIIVFEESGNLEVTLGFAGGWVCWRSTTTSL